jgi:hypothetical protein
LSLSSRFSYPKRHIQFSLPPYNPRSDPLDQINNIW